MVQDNPFGSTNALYSLIWMINSKYASQYNQWRSSPQILGGAKLRFTLNREYGRRIRTSLASDP